LHDEEDRAQVLGNWQVVQVEEGAVDPPRGDKSGADDEELDGPAAIVHMCCHFISGERDDEDDRMKEQQYETDPGHDLNRQIIFLCSAVGLTPYHLRHHLGLEHLI